MMNIIIKSVVSTTTIITIAKPTLPFLRPLPRMLPRLISSTLTKPICRACASLDTIQPTIAPPPAI